MLWTAVERRGIPPQPKSDISDLGQLRLPELGRARVRVGRVAARSQVYAGCVNLPALRSDGGRVGKPQPTLALKVPHEPHPARLARHPPLRGGMKRARRRYRNEAEDRRDNSLPRSCARGRAVVGAGDLFAAGFLVGKARGADYRTAARLGALAAAEVIRHLGARPETSLKDLARDNGFDL